MSFYSDLLNSPSFVFGFMLDGKGGGEALSAQTSPGRQEWIHLDYSGEDCEEILEKAGLSESVIDSLVRPDTRPRSIGLSEGNILILRAVNMNPGDSPDDMVSLRLYLENNRLITLRQRKILSTQDLRKEIEENAGPEDVNELLVAIIERLADRISEYVDTLEEAIDKCEDRTENTAPGLLRHDVVSIRRHAAAVRRYLSPQREALESFSRIKRDSFPEEQRLYLHEQADRVVRYVEDLDLVKEKAILLQEELMNLVAQEQNSRMYVLSIIAAIFLPISFVTGMFGMNVGGLPGIDNPKGFLFVCLGMAAATIGILYLFRRRHWL